MRRFRVQSRQVDYRFASIKAAGRLETGRKSSRQTKILRKGAESCRDTNTVVSVAG